MNRDKMAGKWHELKGQVREKWGKLTHDEVETIGGKMEKLSGLLQKKYGWSRDQADREINQFCESCESSEGTPRHKMSEESEPAWSQEGNEEFNREKMKTKKPQGPSKEHGSQKIERHPNAEAWNEQEKKRKAG